jgi:hypothetical protein
VGDLGLLGDQLDRVLAQRQLVGRYGGQPAPAGVGQVVAGRGRRLFGRRVGHLADQPVRVVVVRDDVVPRRVEGEVRGTDVAGGRVRAGQGPAAVLPAPGVPCHGLGIDVARPQVAADGLAEGPRGRRRTALDGSAPDRGPLGALGDVGTLCEDRRGVRHHLVDGRAGDLGDGLGRLPGPDPRLDVAWAEGGFHLSLQLAGPCLFAARSRAVLRRLLRRLTRHCGP